MSAKAYRIRSTLLPSGFCLNCAHHEDGHLLDDEGGTVCDTEVSDYGVLDCDCPELVLCAACEGDPEAHDLHICPRAGNGHPQDEP